MSDDTDRGIICAYRLDGRGGAEALDWAGVRAWKPGSGPLWLHLEYTHEEALRWLEQESGLDEMVRTAMLAVDPRPRALVVDQGLLLIVRAINVNADQQPEEMVSMRLWIDSQRIITLRHRRNNAAKAMRTLLHQDRGPKRVGQFVAKLLDCILDDVGEQADRLDDAVAVLEHKVATNEKGELRHAIADARRSAISLKRHLAPQRDVLSRLESERISWLTEVDRAQVREEANRLTRILEDLDSARDRAAVTQEEVASRLSELTNRRLYVLSIVAAVFVPISVMVDLFGMGVGGVPLQHHPNGFFMVCAALAALVLLQLLVFRVMRWW